MKVKNFKFLLLKTILKVFPIRVNIKNYTLQLPKINDKTFEGGKMYNLVYLIGKAQQMETTETETGKSYDHKFSCQEVLKIVMVYMKQTLFVVYFGMG